MKTLVVRLDHLGDLLLTTPLIRALSLGGHTVDVLVQDSLRPIFEDSRFVQNCVGIGEAAPGFPARWWELAQWMRRTRYDVVILAYAKEPRLCFASAFSGAKRRIAMWSGLWGRLTGHECLASHILDDPRPVSEILLSCSRVMGVADQGLRPDLFLSESERDTVRRLIPESLRGHRLVGLHPGSAGNACNLPSAVYAGVAALLLRETDCALIVTGTSGEANLLTLWPDEILHSNRVWISMGKLDVRQLAGVVAEMGVYVCSSTGPLHVASAVGTPTVSPFCPTVPLCASIWGNIGSAARVIEPAICPKRATGRYGCDFQGQITASKIFEQVVELAGLARQK